MHCADFYYHSVAFWWHNGRQQLNSLCSVRWKCSCMIKLLKWRVHWVMYMLSNVKHCFRDWYTLYWLFNRGRFLLIELVCFSTPDPTNEVLKELYCRCHGVIFVGLAHSLLWIIGPKAFWGEKTTALYSWKARCCHVWSFTGDKWWYVYKLLEQPLILISDHPM